MFLEQMCIIPLIPINYVTCIYTKIDRSIILLRNVCSTKKNNNYSTLIVRTCWVPQKLPQIYTLIACICIGKVARFAVYICGNIWNAQYIFRGIFIPVNWMPGRIYYRDYIVSRHRDNNNNKLKCRQFIF